MSPRPDAFYVIEPDVVVPGVLNALVIRDLAAEGCKTVTNDAERVVAELRRNGRLREGQSLFYFDSEGDLAEVLWNPHNPLIGFRPAPLP